MEMMCSNLLLSHTGSFLIKSSQKPRLQFLSARCVRTERSTQPLERRAREVTCFHIPQLPPAKTLSVLRHIIEEHDVVNTAHFCKVHNATAAVTFPPEAF